MKLSPTFKAIDAVWHLVRFKDLKKGDIFKSFNSAPDDIEGYQEGDPVDFQKLTSWICEDNAYLSNNGPDGAEVWTVKADKAVISTMELP